MSDYHHILLAVDLTDESAQVADKAATLAQRYAAKISVIHVIEPVSFSYGGDIPLDFSGIQEQIQKQAETQLRALGSRLEIGDNGQFLELGRAETQIHRVAKDIGADLIVVGSHGRHGLALILGSTPNGVLHGATCDVLAVRVINTAK